MRRGWIVVALALLIGLALWLLFVSATDDGGTGGAAPPGAVQHGARATPQPLAVAPQPAAERTRSVLETAVVAEDAAPEPSWRGIVIDADGRPLAAARVWRLRQPDTVPLHPQAPRKSGTTLFDTATWVDTSATGSFSMPWAPSAEKTHWALLVRHPDHVPLLVSCDGPLASGADVGTLGLTRGARVTGRALTAEGQPASGADIRLWLLPYSVRCILGPPPLPDGLDDALLETRTDVNGRFTVDGLPAAGISVDVDAVGHAPLRSQAMPVAAGALLDVGDLRLSRGGLVSGRVFDADGMPLAGAEVRASNSGLEAMALWEHAVHRELEWARHGIPTMIGIRDTHEAKACWTTSDADGRFEISGLVTPRCAVLAAAPGHEPASAGVLPVGTSGIELRLQRLGVMHVRLVNEADGEPLSDASLSMLRAFRRGGSVDRATDTLPLERTGPAEFLVSEVCDAPLVALVESPALGVAVIACAGLSPGEYEASIVVRVPRAASVEGAIRTPQVELADGARVTLTPYSYADFLGVFTQVALDVDGNGRFRSGPIPAGRWSLAASAGGRTAVQREVSLEPGQALAGVDFVLSKAALLQVLLLDPDGQPIANAELLVVDALAPAGGAVGVGFMRTDAAGRAQCDIPAGALRVERRDPPLVHDLGVVVEGETRVVTLQHSRVAVLQGTLSADGLPVAEATVDFKCFSRSVRTRTDAAGHYSLEVPGGLAGVVRGFSPRGGIVERSIEAPPGATLVVDLVFGSGAVRGVISDAATGEGVAGVGVQASRADGPPYGQAIQTDETGHFALGQLADGAWTLSLSGREISEVAPVSVHLPEDETRELHIAVVRNGSVAGVVRNVQGVPASTEHRVYLLGTEDAFPTHHTARVQDSTFRFEGVAPGDYALCVMRPPGNHERMADRATILALAWTRMSVHVGSGVETIQDLVLPPGMP